MSAGVIRMGGVLRVTRFATATPWHRIDAVMREALGAFLAQPALTGAWFGRRMTEPGEERALVSVWRTEAEETESARFPDSLDIGPAFEPATREVLALAFDIRVSRPSPPSILRLYDGRALAGQLDAYVEKAKAGSLLDAERPSGPLAVCMALDPPDRFLTTSVWPDWASIEASTGGDIRRPLLSRDTARLASGGPTHYEVVASG